MFEREEWIPSRLQPVLIGLGVVIGVGLLLAGLGYLLITILMAALAGHAPLLAAAGIGATTILALGLMIVLVLQIARRISRRPAIQRAVMILGFALVMAFWPIFMVWMIFLVFARGATP